MPHKTSDRAGMVRLRRGTWLALCDGGKAVLAENTGSHDHPRLENREVLLNDNPPAHQLGSERPGRVFSSVGKRRAAVEQTDLHAEAETDFLKRFAARIDQCAAKGHDDIILVAPPQALGLLRPHLTGRAQGALSAEVARNYVRLPLDEVARRLAMAEFD